MAPTSDPERTTRRRVLGVGAGVAVTAWAAPTIVSLDAVSAASLSPQLGSIAGSVTTCNRGLDPDEAYDVTAVGPVTGSDVATAPTGVYSIGALAPGTYTITLHPSGTSNAGRPDQVFTGVVVNAGATTSFPMDYDEGGC